MMRAVVVSTSWAAVAAQKECHSLSAAVGDDWCNVNCNFTPPSCPSEYCDCGAAPTPGPSPGPAPSPTPSPPPSPPAPPSPAPPLPAEIRGYYSWNWGAGSTGPTGANMGCSFTGQVDAEKAIAQYTEGAAWCCPELLGDKLLTVGGGNSAGLFTQSTLSALTGKAATIKAAGFAGIMYDVEEVVGPSSVMVPLFAESFAAMRSAGLIVAVTTSHSAPYQCDSPQDAVDILKAWCSDSNIDVISPQLYSTGSESAPELVPTNSCKDAGCTFDIYTTCKAEIAPSIVEPGHYAATKEFFSSTVSRATRGYFMWAQRKGDVAV